MSVGAEDRGARLAVAASGVETRRGAVRVAGTWLSLGAAGGGVSGGTSGALAAHAEAVKSIVREIARRIKNSSRRVVLALIIS